MEWQPIETAEKRIPDTIYAVDLGRYEIIVGWAGTNCVRPAYWEPGRAEDGQWDTSKPGKWKIMGDGPSNPPTHWVPLKKLPAA